MRNFIIAFVCLFPVGAIAQENTQDAVRPKAVSVQSLALQDVGPWGTAALPEGLRPLASDLWQGADPGTLSLLLSKITPDQRFPSLQDLTRQAIFSGGTAPTTDPDIARARFEAANRFGPAEAAARLIFGVPRLTTDPALATLAIDAGLRVGRFEEACSLIEAVTAPSSGTSWLESRAACYALNDEASAANLSVDLAKARGLTDTWLSRAVAAVAGPLTAPPPFRTDSGRAIALSLRAKLKPPASINTLQDPAALSALTSNSSFMMSLSPDERLSLARNGANRGVVSLALLASQQPALIAPAAPIAALPSADAAPADPNVPLTKESPPIPAQITQRMLAASNLTLRAIEANGRLSELKTVMATQPGLMTVLDVPILTEAALWARDGALASTIAALSPGDLDPRLALVLALYAPGKASQAIERRLDLAASDPVARRLALRDVAVAWSAGVPASSGLSLLVQTGLPWGAAGNVGIRTALDLAAGRGSKGEVILLAALATQGIEPAAIEPETLISTLKALRRVGLADGARDLARDYLLATFVTLPARAPVRPRAASAVTQPLPRTTNTPAQNPPPRQTLPAAPIASSTTRPVPPAAPAATPIAKPSKPAWGTP